MIVLVAVGDMSLRTGVLFKCVILVTIVVDVTTVLFRRRTHLQRVRTSACRVERTHHSVSRVRHGVAMLTSLNRDIVT